VNSEHGLISTPSISQGLIVLQELKEAVANVQNFKGQADAARLECIVAKTFGHILHLPVYSCDHQGQKEKYHVHWPGSINGAFRRTDKGPDAFVYAHDFHSLLEATFSTGNTQWSQHFARGIEHLENHIASTKLSKSQVYSVFVAGEIASRSLTSLRQANIDGSKIIPLNLDNLVLLLEPSIYTYALCHFVFRNLLDEIGEDLRNSSDVCEYLKKVRNRLLGYRREILDGERSLFLGLCLYRIFIKYQWTIASVSEILNKLRRDLWAKSFRKLSHKSFDKVEIEKCLVSLGLACKTKSRLGREDSLFEPVSALELKSKAKRILKILEEVNCHS
jgi:hypothetical protein